MKMLIAVLAIASMLFLIAHADSPHVRAPIIVADLAFTNQTALTPTTTLYTPSSDGMFRVTFYGDFPASVSSDSAFIETLSWTDNFESKQLGPGFGPAVQGTHPSPESFIIHSVAGSDITLSSQLFGNAIAGFSPIPQPYNLYVVVEQL